jgi:hypothetical protein
MIRVHTDEGSLGQGAGCPSFACMACQPSLDLFVGAMWAKPLRQEHWRPATNRLSLQFVLAAYRRRARRQIDDVKAVDHAALFDSLEFGETLEQLLEGFASVIREMAITALEHAKELVIAETQGSF